VVIGQVSDVVRVGRCGGDQSYLKDPVGRMIARRALALYGV
jgi:hypothetical protein